MPRSTLPRQLTFNPGGERSPSVTGDAVLYSRFDPAWGTKSQCLATLPVEGGTLRVTLCPPDPSPADTFISTWLEPTLSPSGGEVAFVWQRGAVVSALGAWSHHLTIAPADSAVAGRQIMIAGWASGQRFYNTAVELTWVGDETVRFLAAYEWIFKVKGGGAGRFTDTLPVPRALMDLGVGDRLVIAEVELDTREFGAPAHLWLFQLPSRALP